MKGLLIALQFMTRIPININLDISPQEFGSSSKFFPIVGLIIGAFLATVFKLTQPLFPSLVVGALLIIIEIILTGGLHLDGFMDTADGLLSARPREKVLEIMKDSRVGAHSVTAVTSLFLIKFSLLASLPVHFSARLLFLMPAVGRWLMLFCLAFFPYAREDGLGKVFWQKTKKEYWYITGVLLILLIIYLLPLRYLLALILTFLIALTPILIINKQLNGHTGDTYGAVNEITQVIFLLVCLLI